MKYTLTITQQDETPRTVSATEAGASSCFGTELHRLTFDSSELDPLKLIHDMTKPKRSRKAKAAKGTT